MGKGNDLWDDSALIDAFDRSIATYKAMHSESYPCNSTEKENHIIAGDHTEPTHTEVLLRQIADEENSTSNGLKATYFSCDKNKAAQLQENNLNEGLSAKESEQYSFGCSVTTGESIEYPDPKNVDYDDLLKQYYEIEEKRQTVLQELQHAGYWNHQTPAETDKYQQQDVQANNAAGNGMHTLCTMCGCHPLSAPLIPISVCSPVGSCCSCPLSCSVSFAQQFSGVEHTGQSSFNAVGIKQYNQVNDSTAKLGMMAAKRALNSMREYFDIHEEKVNGKDKDRDKEETSGEYEASECVGKETDLTVVLSAWYSAGFHTGRYLAEQSRKKAQE